MREGFFSCFCKTRSHDEVVVNEGQTDHCTFCATFSEELDNDRSGIVMQINL